MNMKQRLATGIVALAIGTGFFSAGYLLAPSTKAMDEKTKEIANLVCQNRIVTDQFLESMEHHTSFLSQLPNYSNYNVWSDGSVSQPDLEKMIKEIWSRYKW